MQKYIMLIRLRFVVFLIGMLLPISLFAQQIAVQGVVKDQTGETVIGASVMEKGTTNGTITDIDGRFSLKVSSKSVLTISYVGYKSKEIPVNGQTKIQVVLSEDNEMLDEVVVIGYGTMDKKELTSAISHVSNKDFLNVSSIDPSMMIRVRCLVFQLQIQVLLTPTIRQVFRSVVCHPVLPDLVLLLSLTVFRVEI